MVEGKCGRCYVLGGLYEGVWGIYSGVVRLEEGGINRGLEDNKR